MRTAEEAMENERTMATTTPQLDKYFEAWEEVRAQGQGREPVWLGQLREGGWARFSAKGFPSTHDEDWRFTNLAGLARTPFRRAAQGEVAVSSAQLEAFRLEGAACQLVFINGRFAPELSDLGSLPEGLLVCSLAKAIDCGREGCAPEGPEGTEGIEQHLGRYADTDRDVFTALNTALWEDGAYLRIRRGVMLGHPIHLLYVSAGAGSEIATHPRTLVIAEDASQAAIVEDYVSLGNEAAFSNSVTELVAGQNTILSHFLVERENTASFNVSTLRIEQSRSSNVDSHSILLGGGLVRNNVHPVLNGEGAECLINGLFVGAGREQSAGGQQSARGQHSAGGQHIDNFMLVEHARPHCNSRQFYNGILADHARGVFHGRIVVHKDAQKTDAKQTNRNLLLSDNARIDTKPQLEIYADDVKCTHGATIGQIDESQLFYLRARGIAEAEARNLLLYAFAAECLDRMKESAAREFIETLIRQRLQELTGAVKASAPSTTETEKEEAQNWEEVG
jgi:Fe-S cluster assembly protein SufD